MLFYHLRKGKITDMDRGKDVRTESIEEEMIDTRRQRGNRLYKILFPPESPELESIEESYEEEITHKPSLKGRLEKGDLNTPPPLTKTHPFLETTILKYLLLKIPITKPLHHHKTRIKTKNKKHSTPKLLTTTKTKMLIPKSICKTTILPRMLKVPP